MGINILKYFLFCILFFSEIYQQEGVKLKQSIFDQATYYNRSDIEIYGSFIDFGNYKFYRLNMSKIHHISDTTPKFEFALDGENLTIRCKKSEKEKVKCNEIIFKEHEYISFDFDLNIAKAGGLIAFMLILVGLFCLRTGYIYYNIPVAFYSGFSVLLFFREFCELLEIKEKIKISTTDVDKSLAISLAVFIFSILSWVVYGYASFKTKYLRYISFGFIEGLVFGKMLFFFILNGLNKDTDIPIKYFITELIFCLAFIGFWLFYRNRNHNFLIINMSIIASYGLLFGVNILIGGFPFIPYFILAKVYVENVEKEQLYERLWFHNLWYQYLIFLILFSVGGSYFNITGYRVFMQKKRKNISVY